VTDDLFAAATSEPSTNGHAPTSLDRLAPLIRFANLDLPLPEATRLLMLMAETMNPPLTRDDVIHAIGIKRGRQGTEPTAATVDVIDGATFILSAPDRVPAVWGNDGSEVLWSEDEYLLPTGPVGVGKSTIVQQLVRGRLALTDEVLGFPVKPGARNVLLLALDRPPQIARSMKRMFSEDDTDVLAERLKVITATTADLVKNPRYLAELVVHNEADTLVVDSLKDTATPLTDDAVGSAISAALRHAVAEGSQTAAIHHHRKATGENKKPSTLDDVYGSKWITAGAGSVICVWGGPGDLLVELLHLKPPAEEVGPLSVLHDHARGRTTVVEQTTAWELFAASDLVAGVTAPDLARVIYDKAKPTPNQVEKVRRKLERFVEEGFARRTECAKPDPTLYHRTEACG
jgi:replicative DNA helicase